MTTDQRQQIIFEHKMLKSTSTELAIKYGVNSSTIRRVIVKGS